MDQTLTADLAGAAAQYGDTLLFIGFDLGDSALQITVYPGYRFPADDRVHGHIGIFDAPIGAAWPEILAQVDAIEREAQRNYQRCLRYRSDGSDRYAGRAGGDRGVEEVAEAIRESWAGFSLRLAREGEVTRRGVLFRGDPNRPFLAEWRGRPYTVRVYDTGSMVVVPGDRTADMR